MGGAALAVHWMHQGAYDRLTYDVDIVGSPRFVVVVGFGWCHWLG